MCLPDTYFDRIHEMKKPFDHRLRQVEYAPEHDLKAAARQFHTTLGTVRKRRWSAEGAVALPWRFGHLSQRCLQEKASTCNPGLLESCKPQIQLLLLTELVKDGSDKFFGKTLEAFLA